MNTTTVTLNKKQWNSFGKVLKGLAKACLDVDILGGMIRQKSTNTTALFGVDLRPFFGDATFTISNVKEKLKPLKMFKNGVTITLGQSEAVFSDGLSIYTILAPDRNYLDNKFMSQQEMQAWLPGGSQQMFPLIRNEVEGMILKRIRTAFSKLHTDKYKVLFAGHSASLRVENALGSNGPSEIVDLIRDIPVLQPTTGYGELPSLPFESLDYEGMMLWELGRMGGQLLIKNHGKIGEAKGTIFSKGELKNSAPGQER